LKNWFIFVFSVIFSFALFLVLQKPAIFGLTTIPQFGPLLSPSQGFLQNGENSSSLSNWSFPKCVTDENAKVIMDEFSIPHIFADNDLDAYRLQGFTEAVHRFWQMDFVTRVTEGRVSEIVGDRALEFDKEQRKKGLAVAAKRALKKWKTFPESYAILDAYTEGVNEYIRQLKPKNYPIEYKLLGYQPEAWSHYRTALFYKYMCDVLCARENDFEMLNARIILGHELADFLYEKKNKKAYPVIPSEVKSTPQLKTDKQEWSALTPDLLQRPNQQHPSGIGSNNWTIAPEKSISGRAIMSNDPHLRLNLPSVWYLIHIHTPNQNVMGVSFPGAPGITLGLNENIAWGITNVGHDVLDWLIVHWKEKGKSFYYENEVHEVVWKYDTIDVKNGDAVIDSTAWTQFGPVWTLPSINQEVDVVMRWVAHDKGESDDLSVFPMMNKAGNMEEALSAFSRFESPASNIAIATSQGDIAMKVQGRLPIRNRKNGKWVDSLRNRNDIWTSFIKDGELPLSINPDQNYVASANQISTDSTYPYYYIGGDFRDERARTLNEFLKSKDKLGFEDMMDLQLNNFNIAADEFINVSLPYLSKEDPWVKKMSDWDRNYDQEDLTATLFEIWHRTSKRLIFDELLAAKVDVRFPGNWRLVEMIEKKPQHEIFDLQSTDEVESFAEIIDSSWRASINEYLALENQQWYQYRNSRIPHIIPALEAFGIYDVKSGGTGHAPNAIRKWGGPSWRLISEPGEGGRHMGIYPGGQSGHPGSRHYMDLYPAWEEGRYIRLVLSEKPEDVKNSSFTFEKTTP